MPKLVLPDALARHANLETQLDIRRFIHRMGPYYLQAKSEGAEEEFFISVFRHYCDRWPVDAKKYYDLDFMKADLVAQRKSLVTAITIWAGLGSFAPEQHWSTLFRFNASVDTLPDTKNAPESVDQATPTQAKGSINDPIDIDEATNDASASLALGSRGNPIDVDVQPALGAAKRKRKYSNAIDSEDTKVNPRHINMFPRPRPRPRPRVSRKSEDAKAEDGKQVSVDNE